MSERLECWSWAHGYFGDAELGDSRRTARLVRVTARAAETPSGKLSEVFARASELDAAYDFIERDQTSVERLCEAAGSATAKKACKAPEHVFVVVDGSSINVIDGTGRKGVGSVGSQANGGRGLKVISALAVSRAGVPVGVLAQTWWARPPSKGTKYQKKVARKRRKPEEKELRYWLQSIRDSARRLEAAKARGWFQLDREGDAWPLLLELAESGHRFTVRSAWDRVVTATGKDKQRLRARLAEQVPLGVYAIDVPASGSRKAREARMVLRAVEVTLQLRDERTQKVTPLTVSVAWVREEGTTPPGEKPLDWMLLSNAPIDDADSARAIVLGYAMRWRIEEFHKTWKTGACNVEQTQLRSRNAIIRWATILAVVAARIEELKRLSRTEPQRPATDALSEVEIDVLVALKRRQKKRTETVPDGIPTIDQAVRWLADIGGYTGKSSGGPPGSITIRRGLDRLQMAIEGVLAMRRSPK